MIGFCYNHYEIYVVGFAIAKMTGMKAEELIAKELKGASDSLLNEVLALIKLRKGQPHTAIETTMMSESSLAKDWLLPEEDEAWQHL